MLECFRGKYIHTYDRLALGFWSLLKLPLANGRLPAHQSKCNVKKRRHVQLLLAVTLMSEHQRAAVSIDS